MTNKKEEYMINEFFTQEDSEKICDIYNKDIKAQETFKNRVALYTEFEDFLNRPWMSTQDIKLRKFKKIFKKEKKLIYKPLHYGEESVKVFDLNNDKINSVYKKMSNLPEGTIEGYIEQTPQLNQLYPDAVTAVKITTVHAEKKVDGVEKNKVYFLNACVCMARGSETVAQLKRNGLIAAIDVDSGQIITAAVDEDGVVYEKHPDTGCSLKGFMIPSFDKIRALVEMLAQTYVGYFSWDIALTEKGPLMMDASIEPSAELVQLPYAFLGKGKKYAVEKFMIDPEADNAERPYGTKISNITKEGIEFYWKKPEIADGYEVFRGYEEDGPFNLIAVIKKRTIGTYVDSEFDKTKKEVFYSVRSYINSSDGKRVLSARTEPKKAAFRETFILERDATYMYSGTTRNIRAFYGWEEPVDAVWHSDNENVALVSDNGTITSVATGECNIICESESIGSVATSKVIVNRVACEPLSKIVSRYSFNSDSGCWENNSSLKKNDAVIMMVGDMMCGKRQMQTQYNEEEGWNFNDSYKHIREVIKEADFSIGNLETLLAAGWPYMSDEVYIDNKNNCNATSRYLDAVKYGGFDAVAMANNHNCDGGTLALKETIAQVDRYKFARTGVFMDDEEKRFMIADVNGIKVGILAYMSKYTGFNGKDADWSEEEKDVLLNIFSKERAVKDITDCREAGAEFVIAYMHWGVKNFRTITNKQSIEAQQIADAGIDYIVGANPHLVQMYDIITAGDGRKVPCIYSTGNFQAVMNQIPGNRDSVIMRIRLQKAKNGEVKLIENNFIPCYTYTECEGGRWTPVAINRKLNSRVKKRNRKNLYNRVVAEVGAKIDEY